MLAGLVLGGIYAIAAAGLVITYESTGILNFAFGSLAFVIARLYYFLVVQKEWSIVPAAVVAIGVVAPALGLALYLVLFRYLRLSSSLVKVVATIGLSVALPALALLVLGNEVILLAPGLAPQPVQTVHVAGVAITMDQLIVYGCVVATVVIGALVLRFTDVGLRVRALVDSEAMTALSGTNPEAVSAGVWAVSTFFAGLAGVLAAPVIGLQPGNYTLLIAAAFAAVIAAKLRSLPIAVGVGLAIGVTGSLVERYMPPGSSVTAAVIPSIPFAFILVFLLYHARRGRVSESEHVGGALDRAVMPHGGNASVLERQMEHGGDAFDLGGDGVVTPAPRRGLGLAGRYGGTVAVATAVLMLPLVLDDFWVGLIAEGIAFAVIFLSYTLVTGEGGMIWLCQVTFAGVGALTTAQLATVHGWPVLAAIAAGGGVAALMGIVIGLLTIRLGDLYVALVTLTFGLLMENLVFSRDMFLEFGVGVAVPRPEFAGGDRAFAYLMIAVFAVIALFIVNLRRATTGLALDAVRSSEPAARSVGLSPLQMKVLVSGLAAFAAGVGGGFLASYLKVALPVNYATLAGMVWLAIVVGLGARSPLAALVAGVTFTVFPEVISRTLPIEYAQVPAILFGLTAIVVARHPDGALRMQGDQFRALLARLGKTSSVSAPTDARSRSASPAGPLRAPLGRTTARAPAVVLSATDVTVRFGGLVALSGVSVDVRAGSVAGLVGPNGAGKSTLFAVMSGMLRADEGRVVLRGEDVTRASPQRRALGGLARTFQQPELFLGLTVREHVVLARRARRARARLWTDLVDARAWRAADPEEDREVDGLIDLLGLAPVARAPVSGLPLGTTRRVEVARALATSPSVVLLDEPSSGLDARETRQLTTALTQVVDERGIALLLVEHDVEMVLGLSETVYVLDFGCLIAQGAPEHVRENSAVRAAYLGTEVDVPTPPRSSVPVPR
ncbi:MAG TPA: branched-chain amino acid ABC transporter permease/ATP-binding protein [Acidimicrobiia bacterium]|nr:branched-chain amino acid ABC transporter permease/ATP-binding protein [Acidimicrobiia bacterium]